jgi:alpha-tubulin suppressor-like RCC1 family protein
MRLPTRLSLKLVATAIALLVAALGLMAPTEARVGSSDEPSLFGLSIAGGGPHSCGVQSTGAVVCWGRDVEGQASPPGVVFTQIAAGQAHTCGIEANGALACWGATSPARRSRPAASSRR